MVRGMTYMSADVSQEFSEKILSASKIMVNVLAEALIGARIQGLSAPQYRVMDMIYNGVDKPADLAVMLDVSPPAISSILTKLGTEVICKGATPPGTGGGWSSS
jgi:hypothetical protein